jgi:hypothetical protein
MRRAGTSHGRAITPPSPNAVLVLSSPFTSVDSLFKDFCYSYSSRFPTYPLTRIFHKDSSSSVRSCRMAASQNPFFPRSVYGHAYVTNGTCFLPHTKITSLVPTVCWMRITKLLSSLTSGSPDEPPPINPCEKCGLNSRSRRFHQFWARLFPNHYPNVTALTPSSDTTSGYGAGSEARAWLLMSGSGPESRALRTGGVGVVMSKRELARPTAHP